MAAARPEACFRALANSPGTHRNLGSLVLPPFLASRRPDARKLDRSGIPRPRGQATPDLRIDIWVSKPAIAAWHGRVRSEACFGAWPDSPGSSISLPSWSLQALSARSEHEVWNKQKSEKKIATYPKISFQRYPPKVKNWGKCKRFSCNKHKATAASLEGVLFR